MAYYKIKKRIPEISWCGSTIQQNFGESTSKGYLSWDIGKESCKSTFVDIESPYKFYTVKAEELDEFLRKNPTPYMVRVLINKFLTEEEKIGINNKLTTACRGGYKLFYEDVDCGGAGTKGGEEFVKNLANVRTYEGLLGLIQDFCKTDLKIEPSDLQARFLEEIIYQAYQDVVLVKEEKTSDKISGSDRWILKTLECQNILSFQDGLRIDFDKYRNNTVGVSGKNAAGKSSVFGIITYSLFGKLPIIQKGMVNIINNQNKGGNTTVVLENSQGKRLKIERSLSRVRVKSYDTVKSAVNVLEFVNEQWQPFEAENKISTDDLIESMIGKYDDFLTINYLFQNSNVSMSELTDSERKNVLNRLMHIDILGEILDYLKERREAVNLFIDEYKSQNWDKILNDAVVLLRAKKEHRENLLKEIVVKEGVIKEFEDKIGRIEGQADLPLLKKICEDIPIREAEIERIQNKIRGALKKIALTSEAEVSKRLSECIDQKDEGEKTIDLLKSDIDMMKGRLVGGEECKLCVSTLPCHSEKAWEKCSLYLSASPERRKEFIKKTNERIRELEVAKEKKERLVCVLGKEIIVLNEILKDQVVLIGEEKQDKELKEKHGELAKNLDKKEYDRIQEEKIRAEKEIATIQKSIMTISEDIGKTNATIERARESIKNYNNNKVKSEVFEFATKALHRDGIPLMLMRQIIPVINHHIGEVLTGLVEFKVFFEIENNNLGVYIQRGSVKYPLELGSGMEKVFANLAIRTALYTTSLSSMIKVLLIDEVLSSLDGEHLDGLHTLLTFINSAGSKFGTVFLISHIPSIKDMVDVSAQVIMDGKNGSRWLDN